MGDSYQELLCSLKNVAEGLLSSQVAYVWNIYGGLRRLLSVLEKIFKHECNIFKQNGEEDWWVFIQGLNWLRPSLATSPTPVCSHSSSPFEKVDDACIWLHNSLETHTLSEKLSWLLSDEQHLASCYNPNAFLRQREYAEATLICLRGIEQNELSLLTEIHPSLFLSKVSLNPNEKSHRRCSSFPGSSFWLQKSSARTNVISNPPATTSPLGHKLVVKELKKPWRSLPCLNTEHKEHQEVLFASESVTASLPKKCFCKTEPSSPSTFKKNFSNLSPTLLKISYKNSGVSLPRAVPSRKNNRCHSKNKILESKLKTCETSSEDDKAPEKTRRFMEVRPMDISRDSSVRIVRAGMMESGTNFPQPMSTGFFPKPTEGESLTSFLTSSQFARASAELDRENAHFNICEAIISAIEQVKCNRLDHLDDVIEDSDDEIKELKQRIRLRRKQKQQEIRNTAWYMTTIQTRKTETTTTDQSTSPLTSSGSRTSESLSSEEEVADVEFDKLTEDSLKDLNKSGMSLSMASLYSEKELNQRAPQESSEFISSAEGVALSLLRKFSDKHLPRASDIQWLVSEEEVPQELLPMPTCWAVSPDEIEDQVLKDTTPLRGTTQWAPPRPQIIFTLHPPPQRRILMLKQQLRCAGCGMKVAPEYAHRYRYCEYLGRYFCTGCHSNSLHVIPARIIFKWDFNKFPVSNFSYNVLEHISSDPLFSIGDLNPNLYQRVRELNKVRRLRTQLFYIKDFVLTCRFSDRLKADFQEEPEYMLTEPDVYSIQNLLHVKSGDMVKRLNKLFGESQKHVSDCQLCLARGFMCEHCSSSDVIFPWQFSKVSRCLKCGSCFHIKCHKLKLSCPRCDRILARNKTNSGS